MSKKNFLFQKTTEEPQKLFDFLKEKLFFEKKVRFTDIQFKQYIARGFTKIDDVIQKDPNKSILKNQYLSIAVLIKDIKSSQNPPKAEYHFPAKSILFEDSDIIIVEKPAGLPTHSTMDPDRDHLVASLTRFLKARDNKTPYLGLQHRLDRGTSGLILFTKSKSINKNISDLFADKKIQKIYVAATIYKKPVKTIWKIENQLARSKKEKEKMMSVRTEGDSATTVFRLLDDNQKYLLIQAEPKTGRTHQIRVHLHESGMSILGDTLYFSGTSQNHPRMFLHAHQLKFVHPATQKEMTIESPIPKEFLELFKEN